MNNIYLNLENENSFYISFKTFIDVVIKEYFQVFKFLFNLHTHQ